MMDKFVEEYGHMTFSQLQDVDDVNDITEEDIEEIEEAEEHFQRYTQLRNASDVIGEMFVEDEITIQTYWDLIDFIQDRVDELDHSYW